LPNRRIIRAAGTAGQRCTSLRRLIVHRDVVDDLLERLVAAYGRLPIGNPYDETLTARYRRFARARLLGPHLTP